MLLLALTMMAAPVPAAAASDKSDAFGVSPNCPRTAAYYAWQRGKPLGPKKLTELPPATGYMAVYRIINGCDAPLTMVDYRGAQRH